MVLVVPGSKPGTYLVPTWYRYLVKTKFTEKTKFNCDRRIKFSLAKAAHPGCGDALVLLLRGMIDWFREQQHAVQMYDVKHGTEASKNDAYKANRLQLVRKTDRTN